MSNLESFIKQPEPCDWDVLVKKAVIHHQFESIHPFYDGNGRTGRVINILYLVQQGLLDTPLLYLSRYINQTKIDYYRLLQVSCDTHDWSEWLLFMFDAVEQTSVQTTQLVVSIKKLMHQHKHELRDRQPKIYSQDLINNIFRHPYTKIHFVSNELQINRKTASKYLDVLVDMALLSKHRLGKENYYLNDSLFELLLNVGGSHG